MRRGLGVEGKAERGLLFRLVVFLDAERRGRGVLYDLVVKRG
jgi:hypothetical protein